MPPGPNFGFPRGDPRIDMTNLYAFPKQRPGQSILILNVTPSIRLDSQGATDNGALSRQERCTNKIEST